MNKEIICTVCPRGCHIMVEGEGDNIISVEGYTCKRGLEYASSEFAHPVRLLTTTVKLSGIENDLLPVRSTAPIPKEKIFEVMDVIRGITVEAPVKIGDVLADDVFGAQIIVTKDVE